MNSSRQETNNICSTSCDKCVVNTDLAGAARDSVAGWRLVAASGLVFLLPLLLAIVGAALAGGDGKRQLAGALGGFSGGVLAAMLLVKGLRIWKK